MLDIAEYSKKRRKHHAQERLEWLQLINSTRMEQESYKEMVNGLMKTAEIKNEQKFNRDRMDALHAFTERNKR